MERLEHAISLTLNDTMLRHQLSPKHELFGNESNNVYLDIQQLIPQSPRACLHLSTIANKASCKTSNSHYLLFELHHKCLGLMLAHAYGPPRPSLSHII